MKKTNLTKLALAAMLTAVSVAGSTLSFPVFASKCSPIQHIVNVLCGVFLGPKYGLISAFLAALIRNLTGLGSLLAFPGSMFGALLCGIAYRYTKNILICCIGEVFGTAVLGGLCAYPIAIAFMGQGTGGIAFYAYVAPFLVSTAAGATISGVLIFAMKRSGLLNAVCKGLER